jgi:rRNA maturation RNase YbeY
MTTIINLGVKLPSFVSKRDLKQAVKNLVLNEGKSLRDLSIVFTDDDYLLEVNKQYLNHDYFTDVITFDYSNHPEVSGDIMISLDRVEDNALSMNLAYVQEFYRVVFHGVLHLCGYKDKSKDDIVIMREKEDFYIQRFVSRETNQF